MADLQHQLGRHGSQPHSQDSLEPPPARGYRGRRRDHNLTLALWTLQDACLLFMADLAVPFTNNLAERAPHMAKFQMKLSGYFRTRVELSTLSKCGA